MNTRSKVKLQLWVKAALIRTIKTFAECLISMLTVGQAFVDVDWLHLISVSGVAALIAFLTSIAGLPEVDDTKVYQKIIDKR